MFIISISIFILVFAILMFDFFLKGKAWVFPPGDGVRCHLDEKQEDGNISSSFQLCDLGFFPSPHPEFPGNIRARFCAGSA